MVSQGGRVKVSLSALESSNSCIYAHGYFNLLDHFISGGSCHLFRSESLQSSDK
jgi:hypothetical protein